LASAVTRGPVGLDQQLSPGALLLVDLPDVGGVHLQLAILVAGLLLAGSQLGLEPTDLVAQTLDFRGLVGDPLHRHGRKDYLVFAGVIDQSSS
jgi:hypothetical protein